MCVVLIKKKETKAAPAGVIECSGGQGGADTTSTSTTSQKRKSLPSPFVFPASKMRISLFAPIETHHKKNKVTTGVPSGKTHKEITYDLSSFILCGINDDSSESIDGEDKVVDEVFANTLTLLHFRKEIMAVASDQLAEEYAVSRNSLGRKCKLYVQKQYNSSSWAEVNSTEMFHQSVLDQMGNKVRLQNDAVLMSFSFGRSKAGNEFKDERELHDHTCEKFGDGILFSQSETPNSPYVRQMGSLKRDECWNKPARISKLVLLMYKDSTSKLYHGFTQEHVNSFFRIVLADLSIRKDASIYLPTLNDTTDHPITKEIIDGNLLAVFSRSHQNDRPGCMMSCTRKFPSTHESMMVVPPTFKE